jgi:hypothetical protein
MGGITSRMDLNLNFLLPRFNQTTTCLVLAVRGRKINRTCFFVWEHRCQRKQLTYKAREALAKEFLAPPLGCCMCERASCT